VDCLWIDKLLENNALELEFFSEISHDRTTENFLTFFSGGNWKKIIALIIRTQVQPVTSKPHGDIPKFLTIPWFLRSNLVVIYIGNGFTAAEK